MKTESQEHCWIGNLGKPGETWGKPGDRRDVPRFSSPDMEPAR